MKRALVVVAFFGALLLLWETATLSGRWSPILLPSPADVAAYLWSAVRDGTLLAAAVVTLKRLLIGYALGIALGLPLGLTISTSN